MLSLVSIGLMVDSFLVRPTGIIDTSVLYDSGELFAFTALYVVLMAVQRGSKASVHKGETTLTVNDVNDRD